MAAPCLGSHFHFIAEVKNVIVIHFQFLGPETETNFLPPSLVDGHDFSYNYYIMNEMTVEKWREPYE